MNPSQPAASHLTVGFDLTISKHGVVKGVPIKWQATATAKWWSRQSFWNCFFFFGGGRKYGISSSFHTSLHQEAWKSKMIRNDSSQSSDLFQETIAITPIPNQHDTGFRVPSTQENSHCRDVPWSTAAKSTKKSCNGTGPKLSPTRITCLRKAGRDVKQQRLKKLGLARKSGLKVRYLQ